MRLKPRTKKILITLVLLVTAVGLWIFSAVYKDTRTALQRAEGFLFTRMTVAQLGEQGSTRYFYITNRKPLENRQDPVDRYSSSREPELKFGAYDTRVEPNVGLGMFINPSEWFQNEEIQIRDMQTLEKDAFISQLRSVVDASPRRSVLIVVHGFREAFPSALRKTAFVGHVLDINSPVLLFDWPGNQGSSLRGYRNARNVAQESGAELAKALDLIVRDVQPETIWLMANSMGGEVVVHAFNQLYQNPEFADGPFEFEDIILTAPDISHQEFDDQFKNEIAALTRNLTVYVSSNDRALVMSRIVNRDPRRGESTLSPDMLDEAERITRLIDPDSNLVTLVDVTPVNRTRNFHNFSLETPEFFDDLFLRLTNKQTPHSRRIYGLQTPEGKTYWVLTPGR
jgi:esterase/lipase superfamily enzyme